MIVQGLYTVIDAVFIGHYVGPKALSAVTLMFPVFMIIVATNTLVGTGMASVLARQLGAGDKDKATDTLMAALLLALLVGGFVALIFVWLGDAITLLAADHNPEIARLSWLYIAPLALSAPIPLMLTVNSDTMRSEGHIRLMAGLAVAGSLFNLGLNWLLIGGLGLGVFGSALGTLLAQLAALIIVAYMRLTGQLTLRMRFQLPSPFWRNWAEILLLGLPPAINFMGVSLVAGVIVISLQSFAGDRYADTTAAYGIITRVTSLTFLPLLGLSQATQAIVGNNIGAGLFERSNRAVSLSMRVALGYAFLVQLALIPFGAFWGSLFVSDSGVHAEVARLLPMLVAGFCLFAPMMILTGYFQAQGDKGRAAFMGLGPIYTCRLPLLLLLPSFLGEQGIWLATPTGDVLFSGCACLMLWWTARRTGYRYGFLRPVVKTP